MATRSRPTPQPHTSTIHPQRGEERPQGEEHHQRQTKTKKITETNQQPVKTQRTESPVAHNWVSRSYIESKTSRSITAHPNPSPSRYRHLQPQNSPPVTMSLEAPATTPTGGTPTGEIDDKPLASPKENRGEVGGKNMRLGEEEDGRWWQKKRKK